MKREHVEFGMIGDGNLLLERLIFALEAHLFWIAYREAFAEDRRLRRQKREEWEELYPFAKSLPEVPRGRPRKQEENMFSHLIPSRKKLLRDRGRKLAEELKRLKKENPNMPVVSDDNPHLSLAKKLADKSGLSESTIRKAWRYRSKFNGKN